jgi:hypothetical protein
MEQLINFVRKLAAVVIDHGLVVAAVAITVVAITVITVVVLIERADRKKG